MQADKYQLMRFREPGHEKEAPLDFFFRKLVIIRNFLSVESNTRAEVVMMMSNCPIEWAGLLRALDKGQTTNRLMKYAYAYERRLIQSWEADRNYHCLPKNRDHSQFFRQAQVVEVEEKEEEDNLLLE